MSDFFSHLESYRHQGLFDRERAEVLVEFYESYKETTLPFLPQEKRELLLQNLLDKIAEAVAKPPKFDLFHLAQRQPFDYYRFGLDFIYPLIDFDHSSLQGLSPLTQMRERVKAGENVILLANHQTEPDPQIINLMLEKIDPSFAQRIIFVAGHRVINDPLAIPMSLGCNLLCIYSKRHIDDPPLSKREKILHNQKTLKKMKELLSAGSCVLYVAPSGGRDRPSGEKGEVRPSALDPDSLELFWLIAKESKVATSFYPLTLKTYSLMPPPADIGKEVGERRLVKRSSVALIFGEEIEMEPPQDYLETKKCWREERAKRIWTIINKNYDL